MQLKTFKAYDHNVHQLTLSPFCLAVIRAAVRSVPLSAVLRQLKKDLPEFRDDYMMAKAPPILKDFSQMTKKVKP